MVASTRLQRRVGRRLLEDAFAGQEHTLKERLKDKPSECSGKSDAEHARNQ
jgi:hypothetical protein